MDRIIAGRFSTSTKALAVTQGSLSQLPDSEWTIFHNNAPGQHDRSARQEAASTQRSATKAGKRALGTAAIAGIAGGLLGWWFSPLAALALGGIAAYGGSLYGALDGMDRRLPRTPLPKQRKAGVFLAVRIGTLMQADEVVKALKDGGAEDIESATGRWEAGQWMDFDPLAIPKEALPAVQLAPA
jgi:hypothetical protein